MTPVRTYISINGEIHGAIWMPAAHCWKPVRVRIEIMPDGPVYANSDRAYSLRSAIINVLNDGDFQSAKFTPDTSIEIVREFRLPDGRIDVRNGHDQRSMTVPAFTYTRRRSVDVAKLGADYVEECDGHYYQEDEQDEQEG